MKPKHIAAALLAMLYVGACSTLTPEQVTAYSAAGQGIVHGAISDYKTVKPLLKP